MDEKYLNKYRIPSNRLQGWDYGNNGSYFITICTKNREHFFGEIQNNEMQLNEMGKLAEQYWIEIPDHFPFIELGNFVVMPNHVHGILIIDKSVETRLIASLQTTPTPATTPPATPTPATTPPTTMNPVTKQPIIETAKKTGGFAGNKNPMIHENISRIIRWYKGRCTFEIKKIHSGFAWQSRFHDHLIRDMQSFERIQNYIANNVLNWKEDTFYGSN